MSGIVETAARTAAATGAATVTRFAPSPTGYLHQGHAYSALVAADAAAAAGGTFVLRIEDIDTPRCRPAYDAAIREDLAWLGLSWPEPVRRQSEHMDLYAEALHALEEAGLTYPCFCTRKEIRAEIAAADRAPHGHDGPLYPGLCKHLSAEDAAARKAAGTPFAIRLHGDRAARMTGPLAFRDRRHGEIEVEPGSFGDVVLARKETPTSYHLAVTLDDALQGITLVTRGVDLLPSTHVHRTLQALLGLPVPDYAHHELVTGADGARLAKRDAAPSLRELRESGLSPADVRARLPDTSLG